jgi:lipopolysaccharide export system protein LptC
VGRSNVANDAQLKLVSDDVSMLRSKLETRNQLIESKEKSIKMLEKDVDLLRQQLHESGQGMHVSLDII